MTTYFEKIERLNQLVAKAENNYAAAVRSAALRGAPRPVRHKCFISHHGADIDGVTQFVDDFNDVFIPRVVGVSDSDNSRTRSTVRTRSTSRRKSVPGT